MSVVRRSGASSAGGDGTPGIPEPRTLAAKAEKNMRLFYSRAEWGVWWEEFYLSYQPNGQYLYQSVRQFAQTKGETQAQRDFMRWYLGAPSDEPSPYPWCKEGPQDWVVKRRQRGWFTADSIDKMVPDFRRRLNAYEALKDTAAITGRNLARLTSMQAQLDEEMHGRFTLPGLSAEENTRRMEAYLKATERLQKLSREALETYALSLGINFSDMAGIGALMQAMTAHAAAGTPGLDKYSKTAHALAGLIMDKAGKYKLPLPEDMEAAIIDVDAEDTVPGREENIQ